MNIPKHTKPLKKTVIAAWVAVSALVLGLLQPTAAMATSPLLEMTFQFVSPYESGTSPVTVPLSGTYTGLVVDWGDGTIESFDSPMPIYHEYAWNAAPNYHATIQQPATGTISNFGQVGGWTDGSLYLKSVESWSGITSFRGAFMLSGIRSVPTYLPPGVTDTSYMFSSAMHFNGDVSGWDTSSVTNMSHMFEQVEGPYDFNQPLNSWDVSNVTDMSYMFYGADHFNRPLNDWHTGAVTDFSFMFTSAHRFNGDVSSWDTSAATNMESMFEDTPFNGDISSWNVSNVVSIKSMFESASAFDGDLGAWTPTSLSDASYAFDGDFWFYADLSSWRTPALTNLHNTFDGTSIDFSLAQWDVSNVIDVRGAFAGTGMSAENYSATLTGWASQSVQSNLIMDSLRYYVEDPATLAAIGTLESVGWNFIGDIPYYPTYFDTNGASGVTPVVNAVAPGSTISLPDDTGFTNTGFTLNGWTDGSNTFAVYDSYTVASPGVTLSAVWVPTAVSPTTYAVTFDVRGGTGVIPATVSYVAGASVLVPGDGGFSKTGFTFGGWNDGTSTFHAGDTFTMPAATVTLSAQWVAVPPPVTPASPPVVNPPALIPAPITVVLDPMGATGDARTTYQILPGATIDLPGPATFEKPGFALDGWSDGKTFYPAGSRYVAAGSGVRLQAQWRKLKLPQVIPTATVRAVFYAGMKLSLPKLSDAGLPVKYVSANPTDPACTTSSDGHITFGVGDTCQLIASQPGDENYLAATDVRIELNVDPHPNKVRKILFKFVGNRAVLTDASKAQIRSYSAYVKSLIADDVLHVRINVRNYYQPQGLVTKLSTARKAAMRKALVAAGLPLDNQPANLEVHLYFSRGYHARYSWASAPEVRVIID